MSFRDLTFSFVHLKEHRVFVGLAKGAIDIEVLQGPGVGIEEVLRMLARSRDVLEKENYAPKRVTHDDENDAISKLEVVRDGGATWLPQGYFGSVLIPLWLLMLPVVGGASLLWRASIIGARRRRHGVCRRCWYDRKGLVLEALCPECGAVPRGPA